MPNRNEISIPEGYEEVPAGEFAALAQYQCAGRCKRVFVTMHYSGARFATGRLDAVQCCGQVAWWIRNLKQKKDPIEAAEERAEGAFEERFHRCTGY